MPAVPNKPVKLSKTPKAAAAKPAPTIKERKVVYPELTVNGVVIPPDKLTLSCEKAKKLLGWQTEEEFKNAALAEAGADPKAIKSVKGFTEKWLAQERLEAFTDQNGDRVVCRNNIRNREFRLGHALKIAQDILNGSWRFNRETIIIGETGIIGSAQHRLIAFVFACQIWAKQKAHWQARWPQEPTIQALVACGGDESPETIQTLDNTLARTLADTISTSGMFDGKNYGHVERKECSRMLDYAVDLLWKRTQASKHDSDHKHQTHSASLEFLARHPKLKNAVVSIYEENKKTEEGGRAISLLGLSAGGAAAMLYLMAASDDDGDDYRNARPAPGEKNLDLRWWDKAEEFWVLLAAEDKALVPVREALGGLVDGELGGRAAEKWGVICKAWNLFRDGKRVKTDDLELAYGKTDKGMVKLVEWPTVGGIDLGDHPTDATDSDEDGEDPADIEDAKAEVKRQLAEEAAAKLKAGRKADDGDKPAAVAKPAAAGLPELVAEVHAAHPGKLVVFRGTDFSTVYGKQATEAGKVLKLKADKGKDGLERLTMSNAKAQGHVASLLAAGKAVAIRETDGKVADAPPLAKPAPARAPGEAKHSPEPLPTKVLAGAK